MITNAMKNHVCQLLAEHIGNPKRRAARQARQQYILELMAATSRGEDTCHEAAHWLRRLREMCAPHLAVYEQEGIRGWYEREEQRLLQLAGATAAGCADVVVELTADPPVGLCTICHVNPVDAANGYDTCAECLARR
jgi:hypothetical protein